MYQNITLKQKIELFLDGKLDASQADEMWAELLANSEDFEYLQTMASLKKMKRDGSLDRLLDEESEKKAGRILPLFHVDTSHRYVSGMKKYLVAASLMIIGFVVLFQLMGEDLLTTEQSPIAMIEFEIERSTTELNQTERDLQRAITHSVSGDLQAAFDMLDSYKEKEDLSDAERVKLMFVRGSIYYNMEAYEEAAALFELMISDVVTDSQNLEKSIWYLANAQVQLSQDELAIQNINRVIEMDGAFRRPAKRMLKTIQNRMEEEAE